MSGGKILLAYVTGSLLLIYGFLKFESQISNTIMSMAVLLESTFLTTSYVVTKKYNVDKSMRSILIFNIFSTCCLPVLLYLLKNPLTNSFVNKERILNTIRSDGLVSLSFDVGGYVFLLYQALGVITIFAFMLFTLIGTVHILSKFSIRKSIYKSLAMVI